MGNRAIKQPNGFYARFSEIVDDFTHANNSREELWSFYRDEGGVECANGKMQRADENANKFDEAISIIECIHGKKLADERRKKLSDPPPNKQSTPFTCYRCGGHNGRMDCVDCS